MSKLVCVQEEQNTPTSNQSISNNYENNHQSNQIQSINTQFITPIRANGQKNVLLKSQMQTRSNSRKRILTESMEDNQQSQIQSTNKSINYENKNNSFSIIDQVPDQKMNSQVRNSKPQNLMLKGNDIQSYINTQIQKKLSYCINGSNSKEIYPSKIVAALKDKQNNQSIQSALKNTQISTQEQQQSQFRNSENGNQLRSANQITYKRIKDAYKLADQSYPSVIDHSQQLESQYSSEKTNKSVQKPSYHQKISQSIERQKLREICNKSDQRINDFQCKNDSSDKPTNKQELNKNDFQNDHEKSIYRCQSEKRMNSEQSINSNYSAQTCPQNRVKSPQSIISMISSKSLKQRPFSKKIIEKIKLNRRQQNGSSYDASSTYYTDMSAMQSSQAQQVSFNLQIVQQAQRINKYAEYIKQETYKTSQELRPNKEKVKELVNQILQMYQFLMTLSSDKQRIAKIMIDCGAAKGKLIEIFFQNQIQNISPLKDDNYYNKYMDTVERTFTSLINKEEFNQHINDKSIHDHSLLTDQSPQSNQINDLILKYTLEPKNFFEKTYFKILQKDSNGIAYVQEYIDLQVLEDLDNLKTTLQVCLKYTEDTSPQKNKSRSKSPQMNLTPSKHASKEIKVSEFDVKINKYELKKQGIKTKCQIIQPKQPSQQQQQKINQLNINNKNQELKIQENDDNILQYLDLLKDQRNERKGIISEMQEYCSINKGERLPLYFNEPFHNLIDYSIDLDLLGVPKYQ